MSAKEQDAVASMLQLAANTQEQAHPHREAPNSELQPDGDVEMDNPSDSSLSEIDEDPHSSDDRQPAEDALTPGESGADSDEEEDDPEEGEGDGQEMEDTHSATAEDPDDDGDDTEAETERLHESPDKLRTSRNVHHRAEDQLQIPDDNIDQTSEISALSDSVAGDMDHIDSGISSPRKRKRDEMESDDDADDDTAESLRGVSRKLEHHADDDEEDADELDADGEHPSPDDGKEREEEGSGDERASSKEATPDRETSSKPTAKDDGEMSGVEDGEADVEAEADADAENKGEEDSSKKEGALTALRAMEKDFARLRDELFADKMQKLNGELELLQRNPMNHMGFAAAIEAIDRRRDEQVRQAKVTLEYKIKSLQNRSVAERAMAHSQYLQEVQHIRDGCLEDAGEEWYRIQKARRQGDDDEFEKRYHFVADRPTQVARQMSYNQEVSIVSGIQRYVGFPAAPEIEGVTRDEAESDLKKMGISPKPKHNLPISAPISSFPRQAAPMADEHFLKANPWADPQHAYQAHAQMLAPPAAAQTFTTPAAARHQESGQQGSASTIAVSSVEQTPISGNQANGPSRYIPAVDQSNETPSRMPASKNVGTSHISPQSSPLKAPQGIPVPAGSG